MQNHRGRLQRKHSTEVIDLEGKMVLPGFVEKMG